MTILLLQTACIGWSPETTIKNGLPRKVYPGGESQKANEQGIKNNVKIEFLEPTLLLKLGEFLWKIYALF